MYTVHTIVIYFVEGGKALMRLLTFSPRLCFSMLSSMAKLWSFRSCPCCGPVHICGHLLREAVQKRRHIDERHGYGRILRNWRCGLLKQHREVGTSHLFLFFVVIDIFLFTSGQSMMLLRFSLWFSGCSNCATGILRFSFSLLVVFYCSDIFL